MDRNKPAAAPERRMPMSEFSSVSARPHPLLVEHTLKRYTILNRWISRALNNSVASTKLFPLSYQPEVWQVLLQLQQAVLEQLQQQQTDSMRGWEAWLEEFAAIKRVNTFSKLVEQEFNLTAQLVVFFQERATNWIKLQENVQVNYGYWINEQLVSATEIMPAG